MRFPNWYDAPRKMLEMDGHCGLVTAWLVLQHFGKFVSVPKLVKSCCYTKRNGVFTICLAAGLKEHGLSVSVHSDPDSNIKPFEKRCYNRAHRMGISIEPALELPTLLRERRRRKIPIVFFNTESNIGHFSPLLGIRNGLLSLPLADKHNMPISDFLAKWSEPEILRQSIIVGK